VIEAPGRRAELRRVSTGPVVVLTFDGEQLDRHWLVDHLPDMYRAERRRLPPLGLIAECWAAA
jgi:hypothetical protein